LPFLHVGHRYYDPSSGRFLQRDPIGIRGGSNVYEYVDSRPTRNRDPSGLELPYHGYPYEDPPPPEPPIAQSPEDIAKELQRERTGQIGIGLCIGVLGLGGPLAAVLALVIDTGAAIFANNDPIVVPTNPPKTAPKPPGGGAG
jgi:uncharacterized protein RhaS with RHS repeats